jgi:hypothetical protein
MTSVAILRERSGKKSPRTEPGAVGILPPTPRNVLVSLRETPGTSRSEMSMDEELSSGGNSAAWGANLQLWTLFMSCQFHGHPIGHRFAAERVEHGTPGGEAVSNPVGFAILLQGGASLAAADEYSIWVLLELSVEYLLPKRTRVELSAAFRRPCPTQETAVPRIGWGG